MIHPPNTLEYFERPLNLDISNKCRLQCPVCDRITAPEMIKRAKDISLEDFQKIVDTWPELSFCGQISDPIYHPKFLDMLRMCKDLRHVQLSTNGSGKRKEWWDEAFQITLDQKNIEWRFALDGLPSESHIYRVHQDGNAVWEVMKKGAALGVPIVWQYIPFKYNENHIEEAAQMAKDAGIEMMLKISSRHPEGWEPTKPELRVERIRINED